MKKFLVVAAFAAVTAIPTASFAGGACPAPYSRPCAQPCGKACASTPCINPLAPVVGVVNGIGCAVGSVVNGFAGLFSCRPCY